MDEHGILESTFTSAAQVRRGRTNAAQHEHTGRYETKIEQNFGGPRSGPQNKTMAEACRDLLIEVLVTAGFPSSWDTAKFPPGQRKSRCLIDLGFGCGDQTAFLASAWLKKPDERKQEGPSVDARFNQYVGVTLDETQCRFAKQNLKEYLEEMESRNSLNELPNGCPTIKLFCADAGKPESWGQELKECVRRAIHETGEHWVLALDTAYHFSPSRWPLIRHACRSLHASFMAFDLCVSPTISWRDKLLLRILTRLMGAPWGNFVTPKEYRHKLVDCGYEDSQIKIKDISGDVFGSLASFMEEQDRKLHTIGLGLGSLNIARLLFQWWARSGAVRGIIVVAKITHDQAS